MGEFPRRNTGSANRDAGAGARQRGMKGAAAKAPANASAAIEAAVERSTTADSGTVEQRSHTREVAAEHSQEREAAHNVGPTIAPVTQLGGDGTVKTGKHGVHTETADSTSGAALVPAVSPGATPRGTTERPREGASPDPTTLLEFYSTPRAAAFLRGLARGKVASFAEQDRAAAKQAARERDPTFGSTAALAHQSLTFRQGALAPLCIGWAGLLLRDVLTAENGWKDDPVAPPVTLLESIAGCLGADLRDAKRAPRAVNLLRVAMMWLFHARRLRAADALPTLASAASALVRDASCDAEVVAVAWIADPKDGGEGFFERVAGAKAWTRNADDARAETRRARSERDTAVAQATELREAVERADATIADLRRRIEEAQHTIASLQKQKEQIEIGAEHDRTNDRSRYRGFLELRVRGLLETALTAVKMTPPHTDVAGERLEVALTYIAKEIEWLTSSG